MVDRINRRRRGHILTVEDPIEFVHRPRRCIVNQREVGTDTRSFATALRHALRQDPDVILIGEMRDPETIGAALTIAETGHLVLSTLHTNSAADSVNRIVDAFPSHRQAQVRSQLASVLEGGWRPRSWCRGPPDRGAWWRPRSWSARRPSGP